MLRVAAGSLISLYILCLVEQNQLLSDLVVILMFMQSSRSCLEWSVIREIVKNLQDLSFSGTEIL